MNKLLAGLILCVAVAPAYARGGHAAGHMGVHALSHPVYGWNGLKGADRAVIGGKNIHSIYGARIKSDTWNNSVHTTSPTKHMSVVLKNGHYVFTNE